MDEITTERLRRREPCLSDVDGYMSFVSDYEVVKWTATWPRSADREFVINRCVPVDADLGFAGPVFLGEELIGGMGLIEGEIGYFFAPKHWGKGFATEIASAMIARAFHCYDWDQITASVMNGNPGSGRVLDKLGFRRSGNSRCWSEAQGAESDTCEYLLTRRQWLLANPYRLETDRLVICALQDPDWRDLQRIGAQPDVAQNMRNIPPNWAENDVKLWQGGSKWRGQIGFRPAITLLDGTLIGALGIGGDPVTCAYLIDKKYWGQGYATEAMVAFLADAFRRFSIDEINASRFNDNAGSGRVSQKLGFVQAGTSIGSSAARLEDAPETLYRLSRTQFEAAQ